METVRKGDILIVSGTDSNLETLLSEALKKESKG
jgi:hypothetical protein